MLPEEQGETVRLEARLSWMGVSDWPGWDVECRTAIAGSEFQGHIERTGSQLEAPAPGQIWDNSVIKVNVDRDGP